MSTDTRTENGVGIYVQAFKIANQNNQTVGECRDLFVTLEQLHSILLRRRDTSQELYLALNALVGLIDTVHGVYSVPCAEWIMKQPSYEHARLALRKATDGDA